MNPLELLGLEWTRPIGFLALALPAAVLWFARQRPHLPQVAIGTLALWEEIAPPAPSSSERPRGRVDVALALLAIALFLGALALAGPRRAQASSARTWRIVVDRSPAMYRPSGTEFPIAEAAGQVERWLAHSVPPSDRVLWQSSSESREGRALPSDWRAPPRIPRAPPQFDDEDRAGTVWITRAPIAVEPRIAGLSAAAIAPSHGPIAVRGTTRFDWDGERVVEISGGARRARVIADSGVPATIDAIVATWADARELSFDRGSRSSDDVVLTIRRAPEGDERAVEAGRDGWIASGLAHGRARLQDDDGELAPWLDTLVTFGPGRIEIAWSELQRPRGDPAAFAVSWAELFDRAALPHPSVVPLAQRTASAPARFEPPRAEPASESAAGGDGAEPAIGASLVVCALVLATVAWGYAGARGRTVVLREGAP